MPRAPSFPTVSSIAKTTGPTTFAKTRSPKKPPTASSSPDYSKNTSCTFVSFVCLSCQISQEQKDYWQCHIILIIADIIVHKPCFWYLQI